MSYAFWAVARGKLKADSSPTSRSSALVNLITQEEIAPANFKIAGSPCLLRVELEK